MVAFHGNGSPTPSNEYSVVFYSSNPEPPAELESTLSAFDIHLTWADNSDNEEGFILERKLDGGTFSVLDDTIPQNAESHVDASLLPLHTYTYRIKAWNSVDDSAYSNETSEYIAEV